MALHVGVCGESGDVVGHCELFFREELVDAVEGRVNLLGCETVFLGEPEGRAGSVLHTLPRGSWRFIAVCSFTLAFAALPESWEVVCLSAMSCSSLAVDATRAGGVRDSELTWM